MTRVVTQEHFFIMLRKPDEIFQKANFAAMCRNYTLTEDNKIVRIDKLLERPIDYYKLKDEEKKAIDKANEEKKKSIKSIRQQIEIVNSELKIDGKSITDDVYDAFLEFRQTARQVAKNVIGNMDKNDMALYKQNANLRALMLFRNWLPRMIDERFGEVRYNQELEEYEWGRYKTAWSYIARHFVYEKKKLKLNFAVGVTDMALMEYQKYMIAHPDSEMTELEFVDLYKSNINASMRGMVFTAAFVFLLFFLRGVGAPPDDEVQSGGDKVALRVLNRAVSEALMYVNPAEALNILKSPTAILVVPTNLGKAMNHTFKQFIGYSMDDDQMMKRAHPTMHWLSLAPLSGIDRFMRLYDKAWNDYLEDVNQ